MKNELTEHISKQDLVELMTISLRSLTCNDEADLKKLILDLQNLFYFENAFGCRCNPFELLKPHAPSPGLCLYICDVNFPKGFIDLYLERKDYNRDLILKEFEINLAPVRWSHVAKKYESVHPGDVLLLEDFNIIDG